MDGGKTWTKRKTWKNMKEKHGGKTWRKNMDGVEVP